MDESNITKNDGGTHFAEYAEYIRDNIAEAVYSVSRQEMHFTTAPNAMLYRKSYNYGRLPAHRMAERESVRLTERCANKIEECLRLRFSEGQKESAVDSITKEFGYECTAYVLASTIHECSNLSAFSHGEKEWAKDTLNEIMHTATGHLAMPYISQPAEAVGLFTETFRKRSEQHNCEVADLLMEDMTPMITGRTSLNGERDADAGIYFQHNLIFSVMTPVIPLDEYYSGYVYNLTKRGLSNPDALERSLREVAGAALVTAPLMTNLMDNVPALSAKPAHQLIYLRAMNSAANPPQGSGPMQPLFKQVGDITLQMQTIACNINGKPVAVELRSFHQELLERTPDEIYRLAMENTRQLFPPVAKTQGEMMEEIVGVNDDPDNISHLHVVTNLQKKDGASFMFDPVVLSKVSDAYGGENLYLMPSSVDEFLAMPSSVAMDKEGLRKVEVDPEVLAGSVRECNESSVRLELRLSNAVYRFDANNRSVCPAAGLEYGDIRNPMLKTSEPETEVKETTPDQVQQVKMKSPKL